MTNRQEFSKRTKREAFERAAGHCEICGAKLFPGQFEYDHEIECALGGDNSLSNCIVKCKTCHGAKTSERAPVLAKAKRQADKHAGITKPKGRPLPGGRDSKWKRTVNGKVVMR